MIDFKHLNWGMILVLLIGVWFWYSVFTIGLFTTLGWMTLGTLIGALYFKFLDR
jgi:hypothetical protein